MGAIIDRVEFNRKIKRVHLLPFIDSNAIQPLIIIDENDRVSLQNYFILGKFSRHKFIFIFNLIFSDGLIIS